MDGVRKIFDCKRGREMRLTMVGTNSKQKANRELGKYVEEFLYLGYYLKIKLYMWRSLSIKLKSSWPCDRTLHTKQNEDLAWVCLLQKLKLLRTRPASSSILHISNPLALLKSILYSDICSFATRELTGVFGRNEQKKG